MSPVSRLSKHEEATSEVQSETTENPTPETGEVALRGTVRGVEQPEHPRNFDENPQNFDSFG